MTVLAALLSGCRDDAPPSVRGPSGPPVVAVTPDRFVAGRVFTPDEPLVVELTVRERVAGRGLPASLYRGDGPDRSVLQVELPVLFSVGDETEAEAAAPHFEPVVLCWPDDEACLAAAAPGLWTAERVRGDRVDPLVLARPERVRTPDGRDEPIRKWLGVWLEVDDALLPGDRVSLRYVGRGLSLATTWNGHPVALHVRQRTADACPTDPFACWVLADDVAGVTVEPEVPAFARVLAPLDAVVGRPLPVAVVTTDRYGNPSPTRGSLTVGGVTVAVDGWRTALSLTPTATGPLRLSPALTGAGALAVVPQWTWVHGGEPEARRKVGDLHFHTGQGSPTPFVPSFQPGDHAGGYTRLDDALRYVSEVAGADFAASAEHAVRDPAEALPAAVAAWPGFAEACLPLPEALPGQEGWWAANQAALRASAPDGLHVFTGFEWFPANGLPMHRVIVYRAPAQDLPLLPSYGDRASPQCPLAFLEAAGFTPEDALVLPHLMFASAGNADWDATYVDDLVSRAAVEAWQPVGEIFSSRNYNERFPGAEALALFEGDADAPIAPSFRYAWRDAGVHVGVIGASDSHHELPGVDDPTPLDGAPYHRNGTGGLAVVLAGDDGRDAIFDGLRARATYATSGPRVWVDFRVDDTPMGGERDATGPVRVRGEVLAPLPIEEVSIWAARVGDPTTPWTPVLVARPAGERWAGAVEGVAPAAGEECVYTLRATLSDGGNPDAVWTSPVWVRWGTP